MKKSATMPTASYSLLFLFIFLCSSCSDDCEGIDCLSQDSFEFTIKSESGGNDLLFGSNPIISEDEIEVFYIKDGREETPFVHFGHRSVSVGLNDGVKDYYVRTRDKIDAISVTSQRVERSKCCPATTTIEQVTVNGGAVTEEARVIVLLR